MELKVVLELNIDQTGRRWLESFHLEALLIPRRLVCRAIDILFLDPDGLVA